MSHRDRSIANMRCEAKKIYHQRGVIKRLEKENKQLEQERDKYKSIVDELKEWLETDFISLYLEEDYTSKGWSNIIKRKIKELEEGVKNETN